MTIKKQSAEDKKTSVNTVKTEKKMSVESAPINLSSVNSQFTNMVGNFGNKVDGKSGIPSFFSYDPYIQNSRFKIQNSRCKTF